jgi:hypothetical protein
MAKIEIVLEELLIEIRAGRRSLTVLSVQDKATERPDAWRELEEDCSTVESLKKILRNIRMRYDLISKI